MSSQGQKCPQPRTTDRGSLKLRSQGLGPCLLQPAPPGSEPEPPGDSASSSQNVAVPSGQLPRQSTSRTVGTMLCCECCGFSFTKMSHTVVTPTQEPGAEGALGPPQLRRAHSLQVCPAHLLGLLHVAPQASRLLSGGGSQPESDPEAKHEPRQGWDRAARVGAEPTVQETVLRPPGTGPWWPLQAGASVPACSYF